MNDSVQEGDLLYNQLKQHISHQRHESTGRKRFLWDLTNQMTQVNNLLRHTSQDVPPLPLLPGPRY